jgi:hypothetical protein
MLFEVTCKEVGTLGIGFTARSSKLAIDLGERLLALHMKDDEDRSKLRSIVENMSRNFQSHSYAVSRREALEIGLPVKKESDRTLERLMWRVWIDLERELKEGIPFDPVFEVLNSSEGSKLLAPVPQIVVPKAAAVTAHYSASIKDVLDNSKITVNPVDFEFTNAIVESTRLAAIHTTRGKILATRNPDLTISYNMIQTSRAWATRAKAKTKKKGVKS